VSLHTPLLSAVALKERVVAIESLMGIAAELRSVKALMMSILNGTGAGMGKDVDAYFSRTVDASQDLKDAIYRGAAKGWLQVRGAIQQCSVLLLPWVAAS
jgi:hypothetical protein